MFSALLLACIEQETCQSTFMGELCGRKSLRLKRLWRRGFSRRIIELLEIFMLSPQKRQAHGFFEVLDAADLRIRTANRKEHPRREEKEMNHELHKRSRREKRFEPRGSRKKRDSSPMAQNHKKGEHPRSESRTGLVRPYERICADPQSSRGRCLHNPRIELFPYLISVLSVSPW